MMCRILYLFIFICMLSHTAICQSSINSVVQYDNNTVEHLDVQYSDTVNNKYLSDLKERYHLDEIVKNCKNQSEVALTICHWVHTRWKHNGGNTPDKSDAISILEEAKQGKLFRCVEYGITITGALNALGIKSRTVGLKMKGVDTIAVGAGHVVAEAYLSDIKKWVYLDGQYDVMPVLRGVPLNGVELQQAIYNDEKELLFESISKKITKQEYLGWITPYLYFFDIETDNRESYGLEKRRQREGLMLTPLDEKCPSIFQRTMPMNYVCTHSMKAFYEPPL